MVTMQYHINDFAPGDLADVVGLEGPAFGPDAWSEDDFIELYNDQRGTFLVARMDNDLVGYICGMTYAVGADDTEGYVASIAVDPEARQTGLGTTLMEAIIQRFIEKGVTSIALHVRTTNEAALALYRKLGFAIQKVLPNYCEDGAPAYLMRRKARLRDLDSDLSEV
jgi:[ribosomal protein S18]-alanine N-acetyltransferase